jgi:hypothetical protein
MGYADPAKQRAYNKKYQREHYLRNKAYYLAKASRHHARAKALIRDAKTNKPCADCGKSYPYYVMDFDHRPSETKCRELNKSHLFGVRKAAAEIAKCDVVCANCHRIRTWQRSRSSAG